MNKKLSQSELAFFLRLGFIPPGYSDDHDSQNKLKLFGNMWQNEATNPFKFPFFQDKNIGTKSIDLYADEWFEGFKKIVKSSISCEHSVALFLSGGKDSGLIAYALRELGYQNVKCFTYVANGNFENESYAAKNLCNSLGYEHITIDQDVKKDYEIFSKFVCNSSYPPGDFASVATYRLSYEAHKADCNLIIDGMGNDIYMGHIPPKRESRLIKAVEILPLWRFGLWGRNPLWRFETPYSVDYLLDSLLMSPAERRFSGVKLSQGQINALGINTDVVKEFLITIENQVKSFREYDKRAFQRGVYFDELAACHKTVSAAESFSMKVVFPFVSRELAETYLDFELDDRFDWKARKNKGVLRFLLKSMAKKYNVTDTSFNSEKGSFRVGDIDFMQYVEDKIDNLDDRSEEMLPYFRLLKETLKNIDRGNAQRAFLLFSYILWQKKCR
jgi:asparagine synthase (glutamine-hydrolysing)